MDCPRTLSVGLVVLSLVAGCQHTESTLPSLPAAMNASSPPANAVVEKEKDHPPKPGVLVAAGELLAGEAEMEETPSLRQSQLRAQARNNFERALKIDPRCASAYQALGRLQVVSQEREQAKLTYQKGIRANPKSAELWYELGVCHNYDRQWNAALRCLREAAHLDSTRKEYLNALAVVLARVGRYEESLAAFRRTSSEGEAHYRMARTLQHLEEPDLCREQLLMALAKEPQLASARSMLAELNAPTSPSSRENAVAQNKPVREPAAGAEDSTAGSEPSHAIQRAAYSSMTAVPLKRAEKTYASQSAAAKQRKRPTPPPPPPPPMPIIRSSNPMLPVE